MKERGGEIEKWIGPTSPGRNQIARGGQEENNILNKNDSPQVLRYKEERRWWGGRKEKANCILARIHCSN